MYYINDCIDYHCKMLVDALYDLCYAMFNQVY